jgi:hypothetical protein
MKAGSRNLESFAIHTNSSSLIPRQPWLAPEVRHRRAAATRHVSILHLTLNKQSRAIHYKALDPKGRNNNLAFHNSNKMFFRALFVSALVIVAAAVDCPACPPTDLAGDNLVATSGGTMGTPRFCEYVYLWSICRGLSQY